MLWVTYSSPHETTFALLHVCLMSLHEQGALQQKMCLLFSHFIKSHLTLNTISFLMLVYV